MNLGGSVKINKCGMLIFTLIIVLLTYYMTLSKNDSSNSGGIQKDPNYVNLRKLLIGSIQAAEKGGIEVVAVSKEKNIQEHSKGKTLEGANDPVTNADFRSHCVMQQGLQRIFPKLKIISEEDSGAAKCSDIPLFDLDPTVLHSNILPDEHVHVDDITVWIDPLDATQEYTESLYDYVTTMVCVAIKGYATIGVIHNPFTLKTVWAWKDKAMSEDLAKVKSEESKNHIIVVSRSHSGDAKKFLNNIFGDEAHVKDAAGAGYKVLQVVFNNATAYIHTAHIKKWDLCAGNAILNSLKGRMTDLSNKEIVYLGDRGDVEHTKGLLATLTNHQFYIDKIIAEENKFSSK
ncbi:putative inositol monophosphatase 3 [Pseudolycoriella hygida]|uniref:inositol-phosphate phosphatase n=1 Tax=Pseudolycoriella hygida TaxID=35572 RepID=A0A9Q0MLC2_9DIPT|nr:putative inositol monophosphatase 3 [Pseudolycoriella hygida]